MFNFRLLLDFSQGAISQDTVINYKSGKRTINTATELCKFMKLYWMKETDSKSFTDWARQLNESGDYEGEFSKYDALCNLSSRFHLNIDGKNVRIYDYFLEHLPFKEEVA